MTEEEVLALLREAMVHVKDTRAPLRAEALRMEATLGSLGIDSIAALEIGAFLEDRLDVLFPDDRLADVHEVRDLVALVQRQIAQKGG
jgi:acyl carrier protein